MKTVLKWVWRVVRFPFVLAIGTLGSTIVGLVVSCDWLINPDKWNGFDRKDFKK